MLLAVVAVCVARYPLSPWYLAGALGTYAAMLWSRPAAFLLVLPVVLPAWDLGMWTGWMMVGEADLFILTTLAVLLVRTPPGISDILPTGLSRAILLAVVASWAIAGTVGLLSPLGAAPSDNAFLRPDNALRLGKGLIEALLLLPFLRQRQRTNADAVSLLGYGMALGIVAVTIAVVTERALFASIADFSADYRVAGPFSSMRVGGGHIGAYMALALPMALCLPRLKPRWLAMALLLLTCLCGGYTLVVTFARTAYAAGVLAMAVAGFGWLVAARRQGRPVILGVIPVVLLLTALGLAAATGGMRDRLAASVADFEARRANWDAGLAVRDAGPLPDLFGMGLGTYQRAMLMRSAINRPTDLTLRTDGQGVYATIQVESPFFLGQKIVPPPAGDLHLTLLARSPEAQTTLGASLCDKVLLYADQCRGGDVKIAAPDVWQPVAITLQADGLGRGWGWLRRPVELALAGSPVGHHLDMRNIRLTDATGHALLANGEFAQGLDRWIFTDDSHVSWRMLNEYLMLWFETGAFGLTAYLALAGLAVAGGLRAAGRTQVAGAAVAGSVVGFLVSGLFDNVLEAPRVATLFFLVCLCGLLQWESRQRVR